MSLFIHSPILLGKCRYRGFIFAALGLIVCVATAVTVYRVALERALTLDRDATMQRLSFYAQSLEASLERYESLPVLLALEHELAEVLATPKDPDRRQAANRYLETAQKAAGVSAAFLLDLRGDTLAASNWRQPGTFVSQNYAFRPYFRAAAIGGTGRFYAIGATSGEPGYFLSAPIRNRGIGEDIVGVVVIKVGLENFERALVDSGDLVLLSDSDGIVFLASRADWRYLSLLPLSDDVLVRLSETRQYALRTLRPLLSGDSYPRPGESFRLADSDESRELLWQAHDIKSLDWKLVVFRDPVPIRHGAWIEAAAATLAVACVITLATIFHLRHRRRKELRRLHAELEQRIAERTANLSDKIATLERTEAILKETRDGAVQAGKLAVLGQMAAGMTHELSQPLAALHTYADNAQTLLDRSELPQVRENLESIRKLAARLGGLVGQLKSFARKASSSAEPVAVEVALSNALMIVEPRRRELSTHIDIAGISPGLQVWADATRFEQILINLLRNAIDASSSQTVAHEPRVSVAAYCHMGDVIIAVRDNGQGIAPEVQAHLFEPFFTTKSAGDGLGLGLVISQAIAESFGGRIEAANLPREGAEFRVLLPSA